jgi:hypothetical protein
MDLSSTVMTGCFAKAFDMADPRNPQRIEDFKLKNIASHWCQKLTDANLDNPSLQAFLTELRAKQDPPGGIPVAGNPDKGGPSVNMGGTTWTGTAGLPGKAQVNVTFRFTGTDDVTMDSVTNVAIKTQGKWALNGNNITMKFDSTTLTGTIVNGSQMQGDMINPASPIKGSWTAAKGGDNPTTQPASQLVGTTWNAKEGKPGDMVDSTFEFGAGGVVTYKFSKFLGVVNKGTYVQFGASITMTFPDGAAYNGTINGNQMQGKMTSKERSWDWTATNGGAAPNPNPNPPPAGKTDLTNTNWGGKETLPGYGPLSFQFGANGQVTMTDKDGNTPGQYQLQDSRISINFGGAVYTGTVSGTTMQGSATNGRNNWSWNVTNGSPAIQGLNPGGSPQPPPFKKGPPGKKGPFG